MYCHALPFICKIWPCGNWEWFHFATYINWKSRTWQQRRCFLQRFPCSRSVSFKQCDNRPVPAPASSIRVPCRESHWVSEKRPFLNYTTPSYVLRQSQKCIWSFHLPPDSSTSWRPTLPWFCLEHILFNDGFGVFHSQVGKLIAPLVNLWCPVWEVRGPAKGFQRP